MDENCHILCTKCQIKPIYNWPLKSGGGSSASYQTGNDN